MNTQTKSTQDTRGIYFAKRNQKWAVYIWLPDGSKKWVGYFDTKRKALNAKNRFFESYVVETQLAEESQDEQENETRISEVETQEPVVAYTGNSDNEADYSLELINLDEGKILSVVVGSVCFFLILVVVLYLYFKGVKL